MNLNDSTIEIGAWAKGLASDVKKLESFNLTPVEVTKDQLIQLYMLLYPFIASEYVHRSDLAKWEEKMKKEFESKIAELNTKLELFVSDYKQHFHGGQGMTPPVTGITSPQLELWSAKPEDFRQGEELITGSSNYTQSMNHRDPEKVAQGYTPKITISDEYKKANKYKPFDAGENSLNTGDDNFVNQV